MAIETIQQIVSVTEVDMLTSTDAVEDSEQGGYTREIRAYGASVGGGARPLLYTLRVNGPTADNIALSAPVQKF